MQVTKITVPAEKVVAVAHKISKEQMHNEINYYCAEKLTRKMLEGRAYYCLEVREQA